MLEITQLFGMVPGLFPQTGFTEGMHEPAVSFKKDISLPLRQDTPRTQEAQDAFLEGLLMTFTNHGISYNYDNTRSANCYRPLFVTTGTVYKHPGCLQNYAHRVCVVTGRFSPYLAGLLNWHWAILLPQYTCQWSRDHSGYGLSQRRDITM